MGKKVFVGGMSWDTDNDSLRKAFSKFGDVSDAKVNTDRDTGRSKGFGFITFEDEECVPQAISGMNGQDLDGRTIKVDEAQDKPRSSDRGGGGSNRW